MLPGDGTPSTIIEVAPFIPPRNILSGPTVSWELGGVGLNDTSMGLMYQNWKAYFDSSEVGNVYIKPDNGPAVLWQTFPGITELSLTFDQNMNPFLAYVQDGIARFRWYDTSTGTYIITDLESGAITPRASLDDKRALATIEGSSDILLMYIVGTALYYRQQRDRYGVIYTLDSSLGTKVISPSLVNVGMNEEERFQWYIQGAFSL